MSSLLFEAKDWSDSPYINHFISADTVTPSYSNPQDLNRYSYVLNNPLRYTDPTGHNWEDCGDRSGYRCKIHMKKVQQTKAKWAAEAAVQQRIAAQKAASLAAQNFAAQQAAAQFAQQEFMNSSGSNGLLNASDQATTVTSTTAQSVTQNSSTQTSSSCPSCVITGGALIVSAGVLEGLFGIAAVAAVAFSGPAAIPAVALVVLPIETVLGNVTLIGIEYVKQGLVRPADKVNIDYLPLLHIFTNPDEAVYFP